MANNLNPASPANDTRAIDPSWYRDLVESAPDAAVMIDAEGVIVLVNAQTEKLFDYRREDLLGQKVDILVPERYRSGHGVHREVFFAEPRVREMGAGLDLWGRRRDGSEFPVEISLSPLRTPRGVYATAAIRDATDRKRANEKFRALLESAPDAMVIIDQDGTIRLVNAQAERLFGYQRAALVGRPVELLIPERLRGQHIGHRQAYFGAPKVREMDGGFELLGRRKDGSEVPIEVSLSPIETEQGNWATAAIRDITQSKRERDAAVRLAAIVESSNDAIIGMDLGGRITSWNRAAEQTYGYRADEAIGCDMRMLIPLDRRLEEEQLLARVRQGEQIQHFETQRLAKDGRLLEMSLTISPIRNALDKIIGASTIGRDISERKRAEQRFRGLLETAPDAMVIIGAQGRIALINAQAERMFGYSREELIGQSVELLVPERLRAQHVGHRAGYAQQPKVRPMGAGLELWGRRKDGGEFPIEISLGPMDQAGETYVTAAVRDITERKAVERQLAEYADKLERSNRDLEQFAYIASHDLSAPLRSLTGFAQLLQKRHGDKLDEAGREFISFINDSARQMKALIDGLLTLSRVGRDSEPAGPVDLEQVLEQVTHQLAAVIAERDALITHQPLPVVNGSALQLNQLLQNLIANAIKFQPGEQPTVHIGVRRDGEFWDFSVKDDGIGIAAEHQRRIFMIFQRLHSPDQYEGTGIGLAVCQKIVQRHGGRIWVESEPGKGATFHFTLRA